MKREVFDCDICHDTLSPDEKPFVINAHGKTERKKIGHDMVIAGRCNRFYCGDFIVHINASFFVGSVPDNQEDLHFHKQCIEREVLNRLSQFLFQKPLEDDFHVD